VAHIDFSEAADLLKKLFDEQVLIHALLTAPTGIRTKIIGTINSVGPDFGLVLCDRASPREGNWISVPISAARCSFEYSDRREMSGIENESMEKYGDTALIVNFPDTREWLALFFMI
jgi:hypothetical protein